MFVLGTYHLQARSRARRDTLVDSNEGKRQAEFGPTP